MEIISPSYNTARCKSPVLGIPIDSKFAPHIGHCILLWARIDMMFNQLLDGLKRDDDEMKFPRRFNKKLQLFNNLILANFQEHKELEELLYVLSADLDRAVINRNLIAHGSLVFSVSEDPKLLLTGEYKQKEIKRSYSYTEVEQLFYDFSHIAGRLFHLTQPVLLRDDENMWPKIPPKSTQFLRQMLEDAGINTPKEIENKK